MKILGIIPGRSGSKRVPKKNMAMLGGKSLLQRAIDGAIEAGCFDEIVISSNWNECLTLAKENGVRALRRPDELCRDESHDYEFVKHTLDKYQGFDCFAILRPTSPFRTGATINRALWTFFDMECDSLRAVGPTVNHPRKSWWLQDGYLRPYSGTSPVNGFPAYDMPTQALGPVYCQNGCIHIAWTEVIERYGNVSGKQIRAFLTEGYEGLDINSPADLAFAEMLMLAQDMGGKA
jgi:N-acylneuraminate cytidylyltransferase